MIDSIRLQNFRSYKDSSFEFADGVNIVVGPNASGKTNLLEAILVLASGKSYRARDIDLVKFRAPWARLDGFFGQHQRTIKIVLENEHPEKTFEIDNSTFKRLAFERTIPVVIFEPNHLQLLNRGPQTRRDYFDDILERSQSGFKKLATSYRRALSQRNALLKQNPASAKQQLFAWNVRLSELGAQIASARHQLTDDINRVFAKQYNRIAGSRAKVQLDYLAAFAAANYSSKLLAKLENSGQLDFKRGFTAHGPHREDFAIHLKTQPASLSASRGETRSLIIALKIYELNLLEKTYGTKPIFLLDDVFSELDGKRRHHLVDSLKNHQTIITTTDADAMMEYFAGQHNLISL